jgi:parallel beta-helix repeat protein
MNTGPTARNSPKPIQLGVRIRRGILVAFLAVCVATANGGQIYYVSPTGSDANAGTASLPFRQIRKAISLVQPSDTILVTDGDYLGFDLFNKLGTSNAPITIRALGTNAVVTKTTDRTDNRDTIHVEDCAYVVVDGFRSFNANRAAMRIQGGHHVTVRNCVFGNNATWGLFTGFSDDLLIENNDCYGSVTQHGIYVSNSGDRPTLRGNRCHDNFGGGIQLNADVNIQPGDGIITGALLENNVIYNNGAGGGGAFNLDGVQDSVVRNNLLFNNHASGIIFFQIDGAEGPRGNLVCHNTIDMAADGRWALNFLQTTGTNVAQNNILLTRHSFRGGLRFGDATDVANTGSDYNIVTRITPDDNAVLTLAEWQAQGHELHSITGTLAGVFVDADAGNYFLNTNSPALNAAQPIADLVTDLEGSARPVSAGPDIGCYEMSNLSIQLFLIGTGQYRLKLLGGTGRTYSLEASPALTNWSRLASFVRSNRLLEFFDTGSMSQRLYRAWFNP